MIDFPLFNCDLVFLIDSIRSSDPFLLKKILSQIHTLNKKEKKKKKIDRKKKKD